MITPYAESIIANIKLTRSFTENTHNTSAYPNSVLAYGSYDFKIDWSKLIKLDN